MVKIGDLIEMRLMGVVHYGVVCSLENGKVGCHWWSQTRSEALTQAFLNCVNFQSLLNNPIVLASPCLPLWGKFKKNDLIKIPSQLHSYPGAKQTYWYGIANNIEVNTKDEIVVSSFWTYNPEETKAKGPVNKNHAIPVILKTLEVVASPYNATTVFNTGPTETKTISLTPSCTCKSLLYGCSCSYSVFMKTKRISEGKLW